MAEGTDAGGRSGSDAGPDVSIVMPTRNRAALLSRAIESVIGQTVSDWELVVVDDASTDGTAAVLARYVAADPRVRPLRIETPVGAAVARNVGAREARASRLAFLDDDAEWLPRKLEIQRSALDAGAGSVGLVYCPFLQIDAQRRERIVGSAGPSGPRARRALCRANTIDTSCVLVLREAFQAVGGFDERLPRLQDWDLWIRLADVTRFHFVDEPLVRVHFTPGSISTRSDALATACRLLGAKLTAMPDASAAEQGDLLHALGHVLMIGGAPAEGRRFLLRSVRRRPWPPARVLMLALAAAWPPAYGLVSRVHRNLASPGSETTAPPEARHA